MRIKLATYGGEVELPTFYAVLSYQLLVPTNKGCVVEGGYLPVYQLVDPKFEWVNRNAVSVRKGPGTSTMVNLGQTRLVNGNVGDVRKPKPTDVVVPNGVVARVEANGDVIVAISHSAYPNSTSIPVQLKGTNSTKGIDYTASTTLTPDEFMNALYVEIEPLRLLREPTHGHSGIGASFALSRHLLPQSYTLPKISKIEYVATILDNGQPAPTTSVAKEINVFGKSYGVNLPNKISQTMRNTSVVGQTTYTFTSADMGTLIDASFTHSSSTYDPFVISICGPFSASNRYFTDYGGATMETPKSIKVTFADGTVKEKQFSPNPGYTPDYGENRTSQPE